MPQRPTAPKDRGKPDLPYLLLTLLLTALGLIMLFSASFPRAYHVTGNSASYFLSQLLFALMGVTLMYGVSFVPYRLYGKYSGLLYGSCVLLLLGVLLFGLTGGGATRWIRLGFVSFQPSEIAKLSLIISLAKLLTLQQDHSGSFRTFLACSMAMVIIAVLLILEPHFSATIIVASVCFLMMLVGGVNVKYLLTIALCGGGVLLLMLLTGGYTGDRLMAWMDPEAYPSDEGYQIVQSLYAIGSGGLFGLGFGMGRQKYLYLPEEHNDYIFAIVCEELGFVGAMGILLLFALLILRGYWIAIHAKNRFSMLLATGLTTLLALQVLLNVGVVSNLLPSTGISMPFFSSGGTALMMQLAECGILLNISRSISQE
ncbi:MAG: putative lipid II flippase FtsW [Oscillospiraceae bacterium]|nr:putative lipid II flippase FtsW [Oscillospiraceae bacterium]